MIAHLGWNEFEIGSVLFSFNGQTGNVSTVAPEDRNYADTNSIKTSVSHWRVDKPVFNEAECINCLECWIFCPDSSILARQKGKTSASGKEKVESTMVGVDYVHCKGCGVCSEVCPTNPKSLIMFSDYTDIKDALASWPAKEKKD